MSSLTLGELSNVEFLGQEIYQAKQDLEKEANTLYRGKVLINRVRTRDLISNHT